MKTKKNPLKLKIGGETILKGQRKRIELEIAALYDYTKISIPLEVIRGKKEGPTLFISAAVHGDEINGVEIIKRLMRNKALEGLAGTLILVPVVNIFGFHNKSRYLPDRRDLNRCFPGNPYGSLGSRIAYVFMKEVVSKCTHGIDLHTGAIHRSNLPQIRANIDDPKTKIMAESFGASVIINSKLRDGSLRDAARKKKVSLLLFEGGQALRFEETVIKKGLKGCLSVMQKLGMIGGPSKKLAAYPPKNVFIAQSSYWVRAPHSGSFYPTKKIGDSVEENEILATISNPFGEDPYHVYARDPGVIIGISKIPLVNEGEAMMHIATFKEGPKLKRIHDFVDTDFL